MKLLSKTSIILFCFFISRVSFAQINPGNALEFDGVNDYVFLGNDYLDSYGQGTVEAWVYPESELGMIFAGGSETDANAHICCYISGSKLRLWNRQHFYGIQSVEQIELNKWYHVTYIATGDEYKIYLNGFEIPTEVIPGSTGAPGKWYKDIDIGADQYCSGVFDRVGDLQGYFKGKIDELRVWNDVRTIEEIMENLHKPLTGNESGLVLYYDFNQSTGTTILDKSNSPYHDGTLLNMDPASDWIQSNALIKPFTRNIDYPAPGEFTVFWDSIPGPTTYIFQIATDVDFTNIVAEETTQNAFLSVDTLTDYTQYFVRVKAFTVIESEFCDPEKVVNAMLPPGNALEFDGIDDHIEISENVIPASGDFTISVWAKHDVTQTGYIEILSQNAVVGSNFYIGESADGTIRAGDSWGIENVNFPDDGLWHEYTLVKTSDNTYFYLDGIHVATRGLAIPNPDGSQFFISKQYGPHAEYFDGMIDEIRVWNHAKNETEIRTLMHQQLVGNETGLVAYFNFNQESGTILNDMSNNQYQGTFINMDENNWVESDALLTPFAREATNITSTSFTANWDAIPDIVNYYLEVADDKDFTNIIENATVSENFYDVTSISSNKSLLFYRVWAETHKISDTSNVMEVFRTPGNALTFNGTDQWVETTPFTNPTSNLTVECWVKSNTSVWNNSAMIVSKRDAFILHPEQGTKRFVFYLYIAGWRAAAYTLPDEFDITQWHHYAGVYDGSTIKLYIDGVVYDSVAQTGSVNADNGSMFIGRDDGTGIFFSGEIDEVRMWSIARTEEEINTVMHQTITGKESGLVTYYHFDHISGNILQDLSGNGYNGTLVNMDDNNWVESQAVIKPFARTATNITNTSFTANWDAIPDAVNYYLEVADDKSFTNIIESVTPGDNYYVVSPILSNKSVLYYRVWAETHKLSDTSNVMEVYRVPGNAIDFDGIDDYVMYPYNSELSVSQFTVAFWTKLEGGNGTYRSPVCYRGNSPIQGFNFYAGTNEKWQFWVGPGFGGSWPQIWSNESIKYGEWYFLVGTYDGSDMSFYINGELQGSLQTPFVPVSDIARNFYVGAIASGTTIYNGKIDEVSYWNYAFTEQEIFSIMHNTLSGEEPGLLLYYNFDNNKGNLLKDISSSGFNATLYNMDDADWVESNAVIRPFARPATNITNTSFTAHWDSIPDAINYYLEVADDKNFINIIESATVNENYFDVTGISSTESVLFYRVWTEIYKLSDTSNVVEVYREPGNAIAFNGTDEKVSINYYDELGTITNQLTVEAWIKPTDVSGTQVIYMQNGKLALYLIDGRLQGGIEKVTGSSVVETDEIIIPGLWYHVAYIVNGYDDAIYVNGVKVAEYTYTNNTFSISNMVAGIGANNMGDFWYFNGLMDEVRIWNIARTKEDINANMHKPLNGDETGLVAYYNFNETEGGTLSDLSQNGGDGVLTNMDITNWVPSSAMIVPFPNEATDITNTGFTALWDTIPNAEKYYIEVSDTNSFDNILFYDSTTVANYIVSGLSASTPSFYYRVWSRTHKLSDKSNVIEVCKEPGNALAFDGSDEYAILDDFSTALTSDFTMEFWYKPDTISTPQYLLSNRDGFADGGVGNCAWFAFHLHNGSLVYFEADQNIQFGIAQNSKEFLYAGSWYHIALSKEVEGSMQTTSLFLNGKLQSTITWEHQIPVDAEPIYLGYWPWTGADSHIQGEMDEVRIWNYARSEEEINNNLHQAVSPNEPGLEAYFNFNSSSYSLVKNLTDKDHSIEFINFETEDLSESTALISTFSRYATNITTNSFTAHWDSISGAVNYLLEVSDTGDFSNIIFSDNTTNNFYDVNSLDSGSVYYYRVKASSWKDGEFSNLSYALTSMDIPGKAISIHDDQYITSYYVSSYNYRRGITIETWIKRKDAGGVICAFNAGDLSNKISFETSGGRLGLYLHEDPYTRFETPLDLLALDTWYHVALVIEPYSNGYIYINGEIVRTFVTDRFPNQGDLFSIGQEWDAGWIASGFINAEFDDFRVWNTVRTQEQLLDNMHKTLAGNENGLVINYLFDQNFGTVVLDNSINGNNGSIVGVVDTNWVQSMAIIQPTAREATEVNYASFVANWDSIPGIADYYLDVSTTPDFSVLDIEDSTIVAGTSFEADTLQDETMYYFRMRYYDGALSEYSNVVNVLTPARKPRIVNDSILEFCDYDELWLHSNFMKNNEYQWYKNDTIIPGADSSSYNVLGSGEYKFRAIDIIYSDTAWADSVNIIIHSSDFSTDFSGTPVSFTAPNDGGLCRVDFTNLTPDNINYTYRWDFGEDSLSYERNPYYRYYFKGFYDVSLVVTDTSISCTQSSFKPDYIHVINGPENINKSINYTDLTFCPGDSVRLASAESRGDFFQWRWNGVDIAGATDSIHYAKIEGNYTCMITITGVGNWESVAVFVTTHNVPVPVINTSGAMQDCANDTIVLSISESFDTYIWSTLESTPTIEISEAASISFVGVTTDACSTDTVSIDINAEPVDLSQICMVTIDLDSWNNMVVWENNPDGRIDEYVVHRLEGNGYQEIGSVEQNEVTLFVDPEGDQVSFPEVYKMTIRDTCLNESSIDSSDSHRPLFLTYSGIDGGTGGMMLDWQYYEINEVTYEFDRYIILRGTDSSNLAPIDTIMKANGPQYLDNSTIAKTQDVWYRVMGEWPDSCAPAGHLKANNGPFSRALSNLEDNRQQGSDIQRQIARQKIYMYPNPTTERVIISLPNANTVFELNVYDQLGRLLTKTNNISGAEYMYECGDLPAGIYIIELKGDGVCRGRLVVE